MKSVLRCLILLTAICTSTVALSATKEAITVATWNVEHLAFPANQGCKPRSQSQISALKRYAESLNADIVALQEVASEKAARQVFPQDKWQIIMSTRPDSESYECRESGRASTQQKVAFAVRKSIKVTQIDAVEDLGLDMPGLRYGLQITASTPLLSVTLLNVHLKSGCFVDNYSRSDSPACEVFAQQAPILDQWIEKQEQSGQPFIVMGDFNHRLTAPYNHLTQALYRDENGERNSLRNTAPELIGCHPYYPAPIDNIFVGNFNLDDWHYQTRTVSYKNMRVDAMLSDHCAVVSRLEKTVEKKR